MVDSIIDRLDLAAAQFDRDKQFVSANDGFLALLGGNASIPEDNCSWSGLVMSLIKQKPSTSGEDTSEAFADSYVLSISTGMSVPDLACREGQWFRGAAIPLDDGGWIWTLADVTEIRERELRSRHDEKMNAVTQLAGGISHDFNNLLTIIQGNLELIEETAEPESKMRGWANTGLRATARGAELSQRLLGFAGRQTFHPIAIDVRTSVSGLLSRLDAEVRDKMQIDLHLPEALPPVLADKDQLELTLTHLIQNASEAMPDGGRVEIEALVVEGGAAPDIDEEAVSPHKNHLSLTVSDQGNGMAREVLERAFDPFFTTKPKEAGSGLGLSMVYGFAKKSGGDVKILSTPNAGTRVSLSLPIAEQPAVELDPSETLPRSVSHEHILLVEDEAAVRETAAEILTGLGYVVTTAETGDQALEILSEGAEFHMIFSDIVMPGSVDGEHLAQIVKSTYPKIPVLLASGYRGPADSAAEHGLTVLAKPYTRRRLADEIRATLDR